MKRLFYVAFGAAAGVLVVRRIGELAERWTPEGMAIQAGGAGQRMVSWWETVKDAAAEREHELREALGIDNPGAEHRNLPTDHPAA